MGGMGFHPTPTRPNRGPNPAPTSGHILQMYAGTGDGIPRQEFTERPVFAAGRNVFADLGNGQAQSLVCGLGLGAVGRDVIAAGA